MKRFYISILLITQSIGICTGSELDRIIPPEIKLDSLYRAIYRIAQSESLSSILEIGSSSGDGSTEAFVLAINENPCKPTLFCMEISAPRFTALKNRYANFEFVQCYNVSSVPLESFPKEADIASFIATIPTNLNQYGLSRVIGWLKQDIDYVKSSGVAQNGIEHIKEEHGIEFFDMVLIDGSEFTGMAEFKLIYGARFILLDDINAFKNYHNYQHLMNDPYYELIEQDIQLRNGYAIFKRKESSWIKR